MPRAKRYSSGSGLKNNSNLDRLFNKEKDNIDMKKKLKKETNRLIRNMMIIGGLLTIVSLIGLFAWAFGFTLIHPALYMTGIIMGTGWFCTACASAIERR